jgi:hypothetical protein
MCAPVVLTDGAIALVAAHILGIGLIAGLLIINSAGVRKGMSSLLGIDRSPSIVRRQISDRVFR